MRNQGCGWIVMVFMSLVFLALGVGLGLFAGGAVAREARTIAALPRLDMAGFRQTPVGDLVAVTGSLVDNADVTAGEGFVIYLEQEWEVSYDDEDDDWEGDWRTVRTVMPNCTLRFANGQLVLYRNPEVDIACAPHKKIVHIPSNGQVVEGIAEGTVQRIGFRDDDRITAVGAKTDGEGVTPDRLFGGDRVALVDYLKGEATGFRVVGGIFVVIAIGMLIASVVTFFRR